MASTRKRVNTMAEIRVLVDDLDEKPDTPENPVSRLYFSYDGSDRQIDLSAKNRTAFDKAVEKYISASQEYISSAPDSKPVRRTSSGKGKSSGTSRASEVRAWAQTKGIKVPERGRVPADVKARWEKETGERFDSGSTSPAPAVSPTDSAQPVSPAPAAPAASNSPDAAGKPVSVS
jgi:hypothetical protein